MGRRGESIFQRKDGRWEARISIGKGADGKTKYRSVYGHTYSEAKQKQRTAAQNRYIPRASGLFSDIVAQWIMSKQGVVKEQSIAKYRQCINTHILPCLGTMKVSAISSETVEKFLLEKRRAGRLDASGGLSQNTIRAMGVLLQSVFDYAYEKKLGLSEPIRVKKPAAERKKICLLKRYEQQSLEQYLRKDLRGANLAIYLALHTGLRIGEVCALRWGDIDFTDRQLHVHATVVRNGAGKLSIGTPKSKTSDRMVPLSESLTNLLSEKRREVASEFLFAKSFLNPRTLQYRFQSVIKMISLSDIHFHALRHTFATRWIECGLDVKSLSEVLGHASVQVTLDIYVHSSDQLKREAIERMECFSGQYCCQESAQGGARQAAPRALS